MNSTIFHVKASNRRHKNRLSSLHNVVGVTLEGDILDNHIVGYFQTLFTANTDKHRLDSILNMKPCIDVSSSNDLYRDCTIDELTCALMQMHPTKALGLDGIPLLFFQCHWYTVGPSITRALLDALNSNQTPMELNHTYITLILKKAQPWTITNYLPISM